MVSLSTGLGGNAPTAPIMVSTERNTQVDAEVGAEP